jgi:hypothetical protein
LIIFNGLPGSLGTKEAVAHVGWSFVRDATSRRLTKDNLLQCGARYSFAAQKFASIAELLGTCFFGDRNELPLREGHFPGSPVLTSHRSHQTGEQEDQIVGPFFLPRLISFSDHSL